MLTEKNVGKNRPSVGYGYVVSEDIQDRLVGHIFGVIEALGMSGKQEEALKSLIRMKVWQVFEGAIYITEERHKEIKDIYWDMVKKAKDAKEPYSAI